MLDSLTDRRLRMSTEWRLERQARAAFAEANSTNGNGKRRVPWDHQLRGTQAFEQLGSASFGGQPYLNPDDLVRRVGLKVFSKMLNIDDMCNAATSYLLLATVSPGHHWEAGAEDEQAQRAKDFQEMQWDEMRGTSTQRQLNILDGAARGFSIGEIRWGDPMTTGEWAGKQPIGQIKAKNPNYIGFKTDSYGEVNKDGVWQLDPIGSGQYTKVDLEDVVYFCYWPRDDNPYGSPLLRPAYPYYFGKQFGFKQWMSFLERYGHPIIMGKVPQDMDPDDRAEYDDMLTKLWRNLVSSVWNNIELDLVQPDFKSTDAFEKQLKFCNRAIARSLLLPAKVMEDDGSGSLALAREQGSEGQFVWILRFMAQTLEATINEQIVKPSHLLNFGDRVPAPTFKINDYIQEDLLLRSQIYGALSLVGIPFSLPKLRSEFNIPEPDDDDQLVGGRPAGGGPLTEELLALPKLKPIDPNQQVPGVPQGLPKAQVDQLKADFTESAIAIARGWRPGATRYSFPTGKLDRSKDTYAFANQPPGDIEDHMNFDQTNREEDAAGAFWGLLMAEVTKETAAQVKAQEGKEHGTPPSK